MKKLKNNKAAGTDGISAELFKQGGKRAGTKPSENGHQNMGRGETAPTMERGYNMSYIYNKGDQMECGNYRGITLLNLGYKIFSNILFDRIIPIIQRETGPCQCEFLPGKLTIDQIFTLRQILHRTNEYGVGTHHLFIDFKASYDSINRNQLYQALGELGIPRKLVRLVRMTMNETQCSIRIGGMMSDTLSIKNRVRQGDALACLLFNAALENSGTIFYKSVQILAYADDIDIVTRTQKAMENTITALEQASRNMRLMINEQKTIYGSWKST